MAFGSLFFSLLDCLVTGICIGEFLLYIPVYFSSDYCVIRAADQVVSGRQLPKPGGAQQGEIIDPYVVVSVNGVPADCKKAKSTKVIQDNGFNPVWNEASTFEVLTPFALRPLCLPACLPPNDHDIVNDVANDTIMTSS